MCVDKFIVLFTSIILLNMISKDSKISRTLVLF